METITFKGWKKGMRGIPFILLLREKTDISLKQAKNIKEQIVDNEIVQLQVPNYIVAQEIVNEAIQLGVICEIK